MRERDEHDFSSYFAAVEPRLRSALVAGFGQEDGREACAHALAWGWGNWERLRLMENPDGYLYKVGRNHAVHQLARVRKGLALDQDEEHWEAPDFEPALAQFLAALPERQRVCVWLVHGLGHTLAETAALLGCSRSSVATHVRRALTALRQGLEVNVDH